MEVLNLINDSNFWMGTIVGILLLEFLKLAFKGLYSKIGARIQLFLKTTSLEIELQISDISNELISFLTPKLHLVRFGNDEFLQGAATSSEKEVLKLRNKLKPVKCKYSEKNEQLKIFLKLPLHKIYGTQFKLFIEMTEIEFSESLVNTLKKQPAIIPNSVSVSDRGNKIYFLLKDFKTTETPDGSTNNYCYPT